MDFSKIKANRASAIDKLVGAAETATSSTKSYGDDRIWKPTRDKAGNGYAVIRFLPSPDDTGIPWTKYWSHGFQGPTGQWYIERSLTSLGDGVPDPVSELNSAAWAAGDKDSARARKRRLHYVANILVESDPANPENEGKVFLYQFGKKIFEKIMDAMQPEFADEAPINPFDLWEGASFKLKIRLADGFVNYDKSEFSDPSPLYDGDDEKLEKLFNKTYSLLEFTDPNDKGYKSYDQLKIKLNRVLGITANAPSAPAPKVDKTEEMVEPKSSALDYSDDEDDDDGDEGTMSYFQKMAQED